MCTELRSWLLQGHGQSYMYSPGWARAPLSSNFHHLFYFFSSFPHFCPHFGPPGGQVTHLGRPWLHHLATPICNPYTQSQKKINQACNTVHVIWHERQRFILDVETATHRLIKTQIGHARDFTWYPSQRPSPARVILSHERVQIYARENFCSYATNPPHFRVRELLLCDILITCAGDGRWPRYQAKSLACPGCAATFV